jgi:hypothetical protein
MSVDLRFNVFISATTSDARDWIAFHAFEDAVHEVADTATLVNKYDDSAAGQRELDALKPVVSEMLYRLLPKVGVNNIFANQYGIGYALRYGVIEPRPDALDDVTNLKDLEDVAQKGYDADERQTDMRIEDVPKQEAEKDARRKARDR